ncbi:MAG: BolA family transcriptional regulator [Bdellovibrionaceae bacterium]|nr:BolA family transcriptional regulator [Pseudobdellovibrionaceae bacterium]
MRNQRLNDKLTKELKPTFLHIEDESGNHSVPEGSESHFKVVVVSDQFEGASKIQRHQKIYGALGDEFKTGLHALSIRACTIPEWEKEKQHGGYDSPECLGGSKKL